VLGEAQWGGLNPYDVTLAVPAGVAAGNNALTIKTINDTGAANDGVLLASADLSYSRAYTANADNLRFTVPVNGNRRLNSVQVGGFSTNNVALYDVTNAAAPQVVPVAVVANGGGYALQATVPRETTNLVAAGSNGLVAVDSIAPVSNTDLRAGGANYVVWLMTAWSAPATAWPLCTRRRA